MIRLTNSIWFAVSVLSSKKSASACLAASRSWPTSERTNNPNPFDSALAFSMPSNDPTPLSASSASRSTRLAAVSCALVRSFWIAE